MVDFLEKLASFSDGIISDRNAQIAPAPLKIELPPVVEAQVPLAPMVAAVPTAPVEVAPLAPVLTPAQADAKRLAEELSLIDKALANPNVAAMVNISRDRNNDLTKTNQVLNDRKALPEVDFIRKYGDEVFQKVNVLDAGRGHVADLSGGDRTDGEVLNDMGVGVVSGLVQSVGGLTALAAGAINNKAGVAVSEELAKMKAATDGQQSKTMQRRKFVDSLRGELDKKDNANRYEEDKKESGELIATLKSIGRGVLTGAGRLAEDPMMLEAGLSEAGGSLLAGGPIAKGIGVGATALAGRVLPVTGGAAVAGGAGAAAAEKALTQALMPVTIGAMEAGGAYSQTAQEVMAMDADTLMKNNPEFKAIVDAETQKAMAAKGVDNPSYVNQTQIINDAKAQIAAKAANVAAGITFGPGALAGKLVSKFEANPLANMLKGGTGKVAGNMAKEFSEETIQSGVGEFAGNVGLKATVEPNKNLGEGVGDAAIQGGIFGAGSAGAIQAPGLAARGVREAGRAVLAPVAKAIGAQADKVRAEQEASSPLSAEKIQADVTQAIETAPAVAEALRAVVNDPEITADDKPQIEQIARQVETAFALTPEEIGTMSPLIRETAEEQPGINRFELMSQVAAFTTQEDQDPAERTEAALWLLDQTYKHKQTIQSGKDVLGKLNHERPEVQALDAFSRVLDASAQTKGMQDALAWARDKMAAPVVAPDADLSTPEGLKLVNTTAEIARLIPEKLDLASADVILRQDKEKPEGAKILSFAARQDVVAAAALARASETYQQAVREGREMFENLRDSLGDIPKRTPEEAKAAAQKAADEVFGPALTSSDRIDIVNRQINTEGGSEQHQKSLTAHAFDINFALRNDMPAAAKKRAQHLAMFARSMRNKLVVMNKNIVLNDRVRRGYDAFGKDDTWFKVKDEKGLFYNPGTAASQNLARSIYSEAKAVTELANSFAREYPQFGIKEIEIPALENERTIIKDNKKVAAKAPAEQVAEPAAARGSSDPASKVDVTSQATTSEIDPNPSQIELPLPIPEPKTVQKAAQEAPETVKVQNAAPVNSGESSSSAAGAAARPEVVASVVETGATQNPSQDTTQKTEEAFPSLVKSGGRNFFHEAFRFTKEQSSNLMAELNPMKWVFEQLTQEEKTEPLKALLRLVDKAGNVMNERLNGKTGDKKKDKGVKRLLGLLQQDNEKTPVLRFDDARMFNLAQITDGKASYHEQLHEAALVAGADWLANGQNNHSNMDQDDVSASFGIDNPTPEMVKFFNRGMSIDQAKQQLAKRIVEFWGMRSKADADIVYAEGIPQALAAEMLHGFQAMGLVVYTNDTRFQDVTGKSYGRVYFDMRSEEVNRIFTEIGATRKFIAELAEVTGEGSLDAIRVGTPFKSDEVSKTQLRNAAVSTTRNQRKAMARRQAEPHKLNLSMFDLVKQMGEDAFVMLMAGRTDAENLNVNDARSVEGKILGLRMAFRNVAIQVAELQAYADSQNMDLSEAAIFYGREVTRVGRLQMMGLSNPQSDKLARELFMPTRSELDLRENDSKHMDLFWLTVAQGLGVKTEQLTRAQSREEADKRVAGKFAPIVAELKTWLASQEKGKPADLASDLPQRVRDAAGGAISMHGFHSLLSVARLQLAQETNQDLSKFEHFNYLEADGKTNGPINALMLMTPGKFTKDWFNAVRKGGVFFGQRNRGRTLNQEAADKQPDLYKATGNSAGNNLAQLLESLDKNPKVQGQMHTLFRLFDHLDMAITFDDKTKTITIERGVAKNPLTISIYGSGDDGIAGNITSEVVEMIYAKMSEVMATRSKLEELTYAGFWKDLQQLTNHRAVYRKDKGQYELWSGFKAEKELSLGELAKLRTPEGFTFQPHEFATLKANIRTLFVDELAKAINSEVMGHVQETTEAIQKATQIQSIVMQALFRRAIIDRLLDRKMNDPTYRDGDFLSRKDLDKIVKDLLPMGPAFTAGDQSYFLAGSEQGDIFSNTNEAGRKVAIQIKRDDKTYKISVPESFARSLSDDMGGTALIYGPGLAGVKSIPTVVIGSGDGQGVLNIANDPRLQGILDVFDGINIRADKIEEYSQIINGHVRQTWDRNPVRDIAKAYRAFLALKPFDNALDAHDEINAQSKIAEQALMEMTKTLFDTRNPAYAEAPEVLVRMAERIADNLDRAADEIDKRQAVMRLFPMTVDQMASAESPSIQDGDVANQVDMDDDALLEAMNAALEQGPAVLDRAGAVDLQVIEPAPQPAELRVIEAKALTPEIMGGYTNLNNNQRELLAAALRTLESSDYRVVMGNAEQADAWLQDNNGDRYQSSHLDGANGFVDPVAKIIVVTNGSNETTLHELIHASTFASVAGVYADPKKASEAHRQAVENLEMLMDQWLRQDDSRDSDLAQIAKRTAVNQIRGNLDRGQKAAALNEFMAWVLSNQELASIAAKTEHFNYLATIVNNALKSIWKLVTGGAERKVRAPKDGDNVLAQVRFNTRILMEMPSEVEHLVRDSGVVALFQSAGFGTNDRLSDLRQRFHDKVTNWVLSHDFALTGDKAVDAIKMADSLNLKSTSEKKSLRDATRVGQGFIKAGFLTTNQEITTFNQILAGMAVDAELNTNARSRIQDIYDHVMSEIRYDVFLKHDRDPQQDEYQAQQKLSALQGLFGESRDALDRSSLLPAFLALAMVDEQFRGVLANIRLPAPKAKQVPGINEGAADKKLTDLGIAAMDRLGQWVSGEGSRASNPDTRVLMDRLVRAMLENTSDARSQVEKTIENGFDKADDYVYNSLQKLSDNVNLKMTGVVNSSQNKAIKAAARIARASAAIVNETQTSDISMKLISRLNNSAGLNTMRDLATTVVGRVADNAGIYDMITRVRTMVQQARQQFREQLPKTIAAQFSRKLKAEEQTALFRTFGKADLAVIHEMLGMAGTFDVVTNAKSRDALITRLEDEIKQSEGARSKLILQKSKQLARYMMTGEHGAGLLRNAYAVARLAGQGSDSRKIVDEALVTNVDRLVTLYAVRGLDPQTIKSVADLAGETKGLDFVLSYLRSLRAGEMAKAVDPVARLNVIKGHTPTIKENGASLIVEDDKEHARLVKLGYVRVDTYNGSSAESGSFNRSYYHSPVSGRAMNNQGILQTVHLTASGIDPNTGFMVGELTAGRITDPAYVRKVTARLANQRQTSENLLPVFDANGNIKAYERGVDPNKLNLVERDSNLARSIGAWAGRQVEEEQATQVNLELVSELARVWTEGKKAGRRGEFVNLARLDKKEDPVVHEAWRLVPGHIRKEIEAQFGAHEFWVRRDMLNDAVGYRSASVGDLFTGETRWNPKAVKHIEDIALTLFGNKAYNRMVSTERAIQDLVTNAKVLIVVKSVVVPVANLMSNIMQMVNRGVPVRQVIRGLGTKTAEINDYIRRRHQEIELDAELQVALGAKDLVSERRLRSRIKTLKDSYRSLSIWPLIEAGEFSAISNGIVTAEDLALADGKWGEWSERLATKMPDGLKTAWRYGFITRDTALFQGLGKATQYGDFLGKAILFEDLTRRRKMSKVDALAQVNEAFVNYNRLSGRSRQYLESVGLLWFYNFKLRSIKEAAYLLRHHPLRSLMMMAMPGSSVVTDNFIGIAAEGKLGFSIGPGMGMNAFSLNPWVNLVK